MRHSPRRRPTSPCRPRSPRAGRICGRRCLATRRPIPTCSHGWPAPGMSRSSPTSVRADSCPPTPSRPVSRPTSPDRPSTRMPPPCPRRIRNPVPPPGSSRMPRPPGEAPRVPRASSPRRMMRLRHRSVRPRRRPLRSPLTSPRLTKPPRTRRRPRPGQVSQGPPKKTLRAANSPRRRLRGPRWTRWRPRTSDLQMTTVRPPVLLPTAMRPGRLSLRTRHSSTAPRPLQRARTPPSSRRPRPRPRPSAWPPSRRPARQPPQPRREPFPGPLP